MAVLSNVEIVAALAQGRLAIRPDPEPPLGATDTPYGTSSVDLRLAPEILCPGKDLLSLTFDLGRGNIPETLGRVFDRITLPETGWPLPPGQFVLGNTVEHVELPLNGGLAARIEGRSSFARTGLLVHFTAPTIHAGFAGTITLEMINLGPLPLTLRPEIRLCQLIVESVQGIPAPVGSQFRGQTTPSGAP
jgi:dCTP deaminase